MATLRISLDLDDQILIQPDGEIPVDDWYAVKSWWDPDGNIGRRPEPIKVWPAVFADKKAWLRENWTRLGHHVVFDEDVVAAVRAADGIIADFERLAGGRDDDGDISLDFIKLKRPLTPFQLINVRGLIAMNNGANFSVPGAGKTSTALVVWEYFRHNGSVQKLFVVCPRSAFEAWALEPELILADPIRIHHYSSESIPPDAELMYVNYEQLENEERLKRIVRWMDQFPAMLVLDEAHRVKGGANSVRWRACLVLCSHAVRVDLLTGTPMPQSYEDLRNLFGLSWPGIPRTFFTESRLSSLHRGGVYVRTTKRELQLPPMRVVPVSISMSPIQGEVYSALRRRFVGQFGMSAWDYGYFEKKGKAVMALLSAATNPGLLMGSYSDESYCGFNWPPINISGDERLVSVLERYASHEIPKKYQWVVKFVDKAVSEGRKTLIWSTFVGNLLALQRLLKPYQPALIYGAISGDERTQELQRFRNSRSCGVLLSNPQTLGEGISLHSECHEAIYVDRSYDAGLYLQSLDRIHRLGLSPDQKTTVYVLQTEGSIDFRVGRRLEAKIDLLGQCLNDEGLVEVSLPSGDYDGLSENLMGLDELDLNDLLDHLTNDAG